MIFCRNWVREPEYVQKINENYAKREESTKIDKNPFRDMVYLGIHHG